LNTFSRLIKLLPTIKMSATTTSSLPPSTDLMQLDDDDYATNTATDESTEQLSNMISNIAITPPPVVENPDECHNCDDNSCKDCQGAGIYFEDDDDDQDYYCRYDSNTPVCSPNPYSPHPDHVEYVGYDK